MSSAGALRAWSPSRLPSHWLVMAVLFAGALGVGYVLLPGQVQRIAMLERDGQSEQALAMLEQGYRDGDRRMRPMLQLQTLYEQLGRLDQARTVLAELTERHPRDANVLKRALSFHRMTQDRPAYIRTLQTQIAVKYSEEACKELIGLLRLQSAAAEEQGAIQGCRQRGYRRAEDMIRLASLLASSGDFAQASAILRGVDDLRRLKTDKDRTQLTATLIEIDQPREAYRRAMRWLRGARDTPLALTIISLLAGGNKHDVAIELARDISVPGDAVSLAVAELMLDRGEPLAAKTYLHGWIEKARLNSQELASRFIVACLDAEDPDAALAAARRFGLGKLTQPDLVALAEALAAIDRQADFDTVRAVIKPEVIAENPLLGAAVALQRGAPEAGQTLLSAVAVDELDEWRLSLWARLMDHTGRTEVAAATLRSMGVESQQVAVPKSVTVERGIIRRPKRVTRARFRRLPSVSAAKSKQGGAVPTPTPAPALPFGYLINPGGG